MPEARGRALELGTARDVGLDAEPARGSLLANAMRQSMEVCFTHRIREQAPSHTMWIAFEIATSPSSRENGSLRCRLPSPQHMHDPFLTLEFELSMGPCRTGR